jgi:hypothetical protein
MRLFLIGLTGLQALAGIIGLFTTTNGLTFWYLIVSLIIILIGRWYYFNRVSNEWDALESGGRWKLGLAAVFIPCLIASLFVVGLILLFVAFLMGGLGDAFSGNPTPGMGHKKQAQPAGSFGSWWGNDRVTFGHDGRVSHVGDDRVIYDGDHISWVGDNKVTYGADGKPSWIGSQRVVNGDDGPTWIGDQKIVP